MAKKSKHPQNNPTPNTNTTPPNSNILAKLFGDETSETELTNTLFSPNNPFRRKPATNSTTTTTETQPNPKLTETQIPNESKKRNMSKREDLDGGDELAAMSVVKEAKRENPDGKRQRKKRKRDEIEREYEERKFGGEEKRESGVEVVVEVGKKRKEIDNVEEMKVSEEGYDDESKLLRTVFVGNLPLKVKKKVLVKEFDKFGEVESVRIRSVPTLDGKKPKKVQIFSGKINEAADSVHAYIVFKTEQSAEAALAHNMSVLGGNHIRVDRACPPRKKLKADDASTPLYSNKRTVFVGNLPFDVKDEELYQLFCGIKQFESTLEAVRVIRDRNTSLGKGIAYVLFKTREAANLACKKRNLKLRDRELRICHAKADTQSTPSKRKNPSSGDSESTPSKKLSPGTNSPHSRYKVNTKGDTSYQGLRASKSGENKKTPSRTSTPARFKSGSKSGDKVKQRSEKRPSVAARKEKANRQAGRVSGSTQSGNKRKMDARTPQSFNGKKKAKKFK